MSHLVGYLLILGLPGEEVEEVDNDPDDHCNLHVVILPVGPALNFVMVCQGENVCKAKFVRGKNR